VNILITGGAGFIGSHIQDRLISLGHQVGIIDNLRSGKKANLHPKSTFFEVDIRDQKKIPQIFSEFKPGAVFHLAAQNEVPYSMDHPLEDTDINIFGTLNLLEAARFHGLPKFIYSNTGGAYYGEVPESHLPLTEEEPILKPTSFYGVSKATAEQYFRLYGVVYGLPWVSLRYANVYGPRQDGNREAGIVAIFTQKMLEKKTPTIFGDGGHTRDYVFVGDVVDANIRALDYPHNDFFNIATGTATSNNQVFAAIESVLKTGIKPQYAPDRPGDVRHNSLSPAKAQKLLGWTPKTKFTEGIKQTLDYYHELQKQSQ
jgi:UDP-glucose 4-epimerase